MRGGSSEKSASSPNAGSSSARNSFYASKAVHYQEDEEWWRRIELERLHELNREYVERLLRQIEGAGVGTLTTDERAFMERMAKLDAPPRLGAPPADRPLAQPRLIDWCGVPEVVPKRSGTPHLATVLPARPLRWCRRYILEGGFLVEELEAPSPIVPQRAEAIERTSV